MSNTFKVYFHESKVTCWFQSGTGIRHREDGPHLISDDGTLIEWFLDDNKMSFEKWCELTNKSNEEIVQLKLQYGV